MICFYVLFVFLWNRVPIECLLFPVYVWKLKVVIKANHRTGFKDVLAGLLRLERLLEVFFGRSQLGVGPDGLITLLDELLGAL